MIKKSVALAFFITSFLLMSNAYGEDEVYYCAEIDSNGFLYDKERSSYKRAGFKSEKFKIKLDRESNLIELAEDDGHRDEYTCKIPVPIGRPELMTCTDFSLSQFNFNTNNGRFIFSHGFGYVGSMEDSEHPDSISISYGKCDKF
jgi:hypothetical protein